MPEVVIMVMVMVVVVGMPVGRVLNSGLPGCIDGRPDAQANEQDLIKPNSEPAVKQVINEAAADNGRCAKNKQDPH
jgi:hypothetical protein